MSMINPKSLIVYHKLWKAARELSLDELQEYIEGKCLDGGLFHDGQPVYLRVGDCIEFILNNGTRQDAIDFLTALSGEDSHWSWYWGKLECSHNWLQKYFPAGIMA